MRHETPRLALHFSRVNGWSDVRIAAWKEDYYGVLNFDLVSVSLCWAGCVHEAFSSERHAALGVKHLSEAQPVAEVNLMCPGVTATLGCPSCLHKRRAM